MKQTIKQAPKNAAKSPTAVRFQEGEETQLQELSEATGLNISELIRRAVRFATPKFLSGEVNVATLVRAKK